MSEARFSRLLERFDPFDPEFVEHFWDVCGELREQCPIVHSDAHGGFWTVSRFDGVMSGFADNDGLTTVPTTTIPPNPASVPMLPLQAEPAMHRDLRRFLNPYFRAAEVAKYEVGIRDVVTRLIDGFVERGSCEVIGELGRPLAGDVVFRQVLGLPDSEVAAAYHWTLQIVRGPTASERAMIYEKFTELVAGLLERRRAEPQRDDVVGGLLHGTVGDRPMTDDEMQRTVMHLIAAGLDTTAHALGNIVIRLAEDPALCRQLASDLALVPGAVEELLRIDPPAGGLVRTATHDMVIDGAHVHAGDRVLLLVAGANRDPRVFDDPQAFVMERGDRHLAWGYGAHLCLGMHLARLELRILVEEIVARLADLRLVDDHIEFDPGCSRGPTALNITFAPGDRRHERRENHTAHEQTGV